MSVTTPQIEWFIARDGARHGPISDVEMRKFVELGHLKPTDLVWCPTFADWQYASQVFGGSFAAPPVPAPGPMQNAAHAEASEQVPAHGPAAAADQGGGSAARSPAVAQVHAATAPGATIGSPGTAAPGSNAGVGENKPAPALNDDAAWAMAMRAVLQQPQPQPQAQPQVQAYQRPQPQPQPRPPVGPSLAAETAPSRPAYGAGRPQFGAQAGGADQGTAKGGYSPAEYAPRDQAPRQYDHTDYSPRQAEAELSHHAGPRTEEAADFEPARPRRDWVGVAAGAAAVIMIMGGLGWMMWQNRSVVAGASSIGSAIKAKVSSVPAADTFRLSPYDAPGETRDLIDASLQRNAIWRLLKRDHADWYGERLVDVERMRNEKRDEKAIRRFLADVIVTLRRRNAQAALQSSPEHLRGMAKAFSENLRQLGSRDGSTCFAFITFGEANPISMDLSSTPAYAETLQRQMIAIFEAIGDGKANQSVHPVTRRTDYDLLTKDLLARGWSQSDLATFSDPQKLSSSPPEKVCTLVQEWFATHLAMSDKELQTRLLAESLKPLVGG